MGNDKKLTIPAMAVQNLKARKFRTGFMMFFVVLMSATVFFSTILMNNLKQGIENTTKRMGADIIVVPKEGTEQIRDSLFSGTPCSVFFNETLENEVSQIEGVEAISAQLYIATLGASCCDIPVQLIAFDPETDFVVQPWLAEQNKEGLKKGQVLIGSRVEANIGESVKFYETYFEVAGKLERTGMGYDGSVFMTFETLYELKNSEVAKESLPVAEMENMVSMLMVDINDEIDKGDMALLRIEIGKVGPEGGKLYACTADDLMSGIASQVKKLSGYGSILTYISFISTALALISIFIITINERKYEFGILYTLGAKKAQITNIILSEALLISGIGGALGVIIAYYLLSTFKNIISSTLEIPYLDISMGQVIPIIAMCMVIATGTGMIAAFCSSYRISKGEAYRLIRESE